jgi:tripartite-type tricarboxylate transporter receptor subunit TctC
LHSIVFAILRRHDAILCLRLGDGYGRLPTVTLRHIMHSFRKQAAVAGFCVAVQLLTGAPAADAADAFYKGKRLSVLINFAVGGPTDLEGRLFAKYLAKHTEGQPSVIVQNMDGAGGMMGATYLGTLGPRDGTMLAYLSGTSWQAVAEPERFKIEFKTHEFIAYQPGTTIHFVRTDVAPGLKEPADIVKAKGLVAGGLSADTSKDLRLRMALDMLGVPHQYVTGYLSSAPARLALERGEIHMFSESVPTYRAVVEPRLVKTGQLIPVFYDSSDTSDTPPVSKQMEGLAIPTFPQLYKTIKGTLPSGQLWEAYRTIFDVNATMQRLIVMPPGVPQAAADALRAAVERVNNDKDFAAEATKAISFVPEYVTGGTINTQVREMLTASPEIRAFIAEYTKRARR